MNFKKLWLKTDSRRDFKNIYPCKNKNFRKLKNVNNINIKY